MLAVVTLREIKLIDLTFTFAQLKGTQTVNHKLAVV